MSSLAEFRRTGSYGYCDCCHRATFVQPMANPAGGTNNYCYVCGNVPSTLPTASYSPDQRLILNALSLVIDTVKPPPKPKKPKTEGPEVRPMRRAR